MLRVLWRNSFASSVWRRHSGQFCWSSTLRASLMHTIAPYGQWDSPISGSVLTKSGASLGEVAAYGSGVLYSVTLPGHKGRTSLAFTTVDTPYEKLCTDESHGSIRASVHEYGGGAFAVLADGSVVFTHQSAGQSGVQILNMESQRSTTLIAPSATHRYADFGPHPTQASIMAAVEEDHSRPLAAGVRNRLVCLDKHDVHCLDDTHDFYAYPRFSTDGCWISWVTWDHPSMPFWGSKLWVARIEKGSSWKLRQVTCVAGGNEEVAQQPIWVPGKDAVLLYTLTSANGAQVCQVNLESKQCNAEEPPTVVPTALLSSDEFEVQPPLWTLNASSLVALDEHYVMFVKTVQAHDSLVLVDRLHKRYHELDLPWTCISQLRALSPTTCTCIASSGTTSPSLVHLDLLPMLSSLNLRPVIKTLRSTAADAIPASYISLPEPIQFPTQLPDGSEGTAHALYYAPQNPDFTAPTDTLPPCRILPHSGPTSRASASLDLAIQYWTTRGWAVCAVNFGGSTGYGYSYMQRLNGYWGDMDVRDCVAAAAYLGGLSPPWQAKTHEPDHYSLQEDNYEDGSRQITVTQYCTSHRSDLLLASLFGILTGIATSSVETWLGTATTLPWCTGLAFACCAMIYRAFYHVQAESICVVPQLGVQLEMHRGFRWHSNGRRFFKTMTERQFIPRDTILDFFMLEALQWWRVQDYAALAISSGAKKESLAVVFSHLLPPRSLYIETYRRLYSTLFEKQPLGPSPRVDASRMCISGRSSGGLTVLCALVQYPNLFCAAASSYGISNLMDFNDSTHKFELRYTEGLMGGTLAENRDEYWRRSALFHASKIKTPLLLTHGSNDKVVSPTQSRDLAAALRDLHRPVCYEEYDGEGHGYRSAEVRQHWIEKEFSYFTEFASAPQQPHKN